MAVISSAVHFAPMSWGATDEMPQRADPAAWGSDHVGQNFPEYITGDECLFCHRRIGPTWNNNRHQLTIRSADRDDPAMELLRELSGYNEAAEQTQFLMGSRRITRFLRRSKKYGKLDILSSSYVPQREDRNKSRRLKGSDLLGWNAETFGNRCAGCHATAVDTRTRAFSATSLDCFTCHGNVELEHTKDVSRVFLSSKSREHRQITSACGQCHLRRGTSRSSGLPYPNTFVAGDNLFRDFQVDFSDAAIKDLPAIEQHIYLNARDVVVFARSAMTCLACHDVHAQKSEKHKQLEHATICSSCHVPRTDMSELRHLLLPANRLRAHSRVCDY